MENNSIFDEIKYSARNLLENGNLQEYIRSVVHHYVYKSSNNILMNSEELKKIFEELITDMLKRDVKIWREFFAVDRVIDDIKKEAIEEIRKEAAKYFNKNIEIKIKEYYEHT